MNLDRRGGAWIERGRGLRNRLLASARFRRWAMRFPLTRPIARRRARALFDLCAGFVYSQVLLACVRLRVFDLLRDASQTPEALAPSLGLTPAATRRLLHAAAALRLLERRGGDRFGLGELGAVLLGSPEIVAMIEHHPMLYADLADPVALLRDEPRTTALGGFWPYAPGASREGVASLDDADVAGYSALMAASQPLVAEDVLDAYSLRNHRCLLDVGGGDGTFLLAAARRAPHLQLLLFDLPAVAARAGERFAAAGLDARASACGGDFTADALPRGADVVSLIRVVHDHDDDRALALLRAVRRALPDDGVLLLAEPMSGTGAEPMSEAYFGFYLLAMGSGRARSEAELATLLRDAGFAHVERRRTRTPLQTSLLVARPTAPA